MVLISYFVFQVLQISSRGCIYAWVLPKATAWSFSPDNHGYGTDISKNLRCGTQATWGKYFHYLLFWSNTYIWNWRLIAFFIPLFFFLIFILLNHKEVPPSQGPCVHIVDSVMRISYSTFLSLVACWHLK